MLGGKPSYHDVDADSGDDAGENARERVFVGRQPTRELNPRDAAKGTAE